MKDIVNRFIGCIFFIVGTSIGAGMIGLPFKTVGMNFYLVVFVFFITWLFMLITAIALIEVSMSVGYNCNLIGICDKILGRTFARFICIVYLMFIYSLMAAYISGGTAMVADIFNLKLDNSYVIFILSLLFILPFMFIIYFGTNVSDYLNRIFVFLLFFFYLFIIFKTYNVNVFSINERLINLNLAMLSLPVIVTSFGYHLLIPSLFVYMFKNVKYLIIATIVGSFIPFCVYIVWEYIVLMKLSSVGRDVFFNIVDGSANSFSKISLLLDSDYYVIISLSIFSFFALVSSLLGVSIGMFDFFLELFRENRFGNLKLRLFILFLIFILPVFFIIYIPHCFIFALTYAGVFASILLIIIPLILLWYSRYVIKINKNFVLLGGKPVIVIAFFFGVVVFMSQFLV